MKPGPPHRSIYVVIVVRYHVVCMIYSVGDIHDTQRFFSSCSSTSVGCDRGWGPFWCLFHSLVDSFPSPIPFAEPRQELVRSPSSWYDRFCCLVPSFGNPAKTRNSLPPPPPKPVIFLRFMACRRHIIQYIHLI